MAGMQQAVVQRHWLEEGLLHNSSSSGLHRKVLVDEHRLHGLDLSRWSAG